MSKKATNKNQRSFVSTALGLLCLFACSCSKSAGGPTNWLDSITDPHRKRMCIYRSSNIERSLDPGHFWQVKRLVMPYSKEAIL